MLIFHSRLVNDPVYIGQPKTDANVFQVTEKGVPRTRRLSVEAHDQCFVAVSEKQSLQILVNLPFTKLQALFLPSASS